MQQSKVMIRLKSDSLRHDAQWVVLVEIIREQRKHRAYTLTTYRQHVPDRIVQRGWLAIINQIVERLIHLL